MKKKKTSFIYALCDPRTDQVCYIGKSNNPKNRFKSHVCMGLKINKTPTLKNNWIKSLINNGLLPTLKIIKECPLEDVDKFEIYYIKKYRKINPKLKNMTAGGDGGADLFPKKNPRNKKVIGSNYKMWPHKVKHFFSMSAAARFIKSNQTSILSSINNHGITKGWFFCFEGQELTLPAENKRNKNSKYIECSNGKIYDTVTIAATELNIPSKRIYKAVKNKIKTGGLLFWEKGTPRPLGRIAGIPIICVNNDKEYPNARIASKELQIPYQKISEVLRGDRKHIKGLSFKYHKKKSDSRHKNKVVILINELTKIKSEFTRILDASYFLGYKNSTQLSNHINSNKTTPIRGHLVKIKRI